MTKDELNIIAEELSKYEHAGYDNTIAAKLDSIEAAILYDYIQHIPTKQVKIIDLALFEKVSGFKKDMVVKAIKILKNKFNYNFITEPVGCLYIVPQEEIK